ncbi:MAG TPA: DUF3455 domain-containing protein [Verrucomicrobiae bacterium]
MKNSNIEWAGRIFGSAVTSLKSGVALLVFAAAALTAQAGTDNRAPEVPEGIKVGDTNKVSFHGFGVGFQVYTWNGVSWGGPIPDATLFDQDGNVVAQHFGVFADNGSFIGPAWQSNSGSEVVGKIPPAAVTVNTDAIPWLRLEALITEGSGIFANTTFIQRVNTVGGKAPKDNGTFVGQVARVPYMADYFFYRAAVTND